MKRSHDAVGLFFIFRSCEPLARVNADCPAGRSRRSEAQARPALGGAAASGAFLGDNTAYYVGHRYGARINDRFFSGEKARKRIEWAQQQVSERGGELILIARFIPGGRTVVTLSAGTLGYPWRRFVIFDAAAALVWALYASLLGYFG